MNDTLSRPDVNARLSRTRALAQVGTAGLQRLVEKRALVVGCGGLGHPVAAYLAGAGVGHLTLMDDDDVEESNLNRQILFGVKDQGRPKAAALHDHIRAQQPHVSVAVMEMRLSERNALGLCRSHHVVLDCTDHPSTKFHLQDACLKAGVPLVHGGAVRWEGQVTVVAPGGRPCLRCLFEDVPDADHCQDAGVMPGVCGAVGGVMAAEAVKQLLGGAPGLQGRMLTLDLWEGRARVQPLYAREGCPHCASAAPRR
jgi:molybdopterin/thiamine biosynthesis adenylyltransferase